MQVDCGEYESELSEDCKMCRVLPPKICGGYFLTARQTGEGQPYLRCEAIIDKKNVPTLNRTTWPRFGVLC